MEYLTKEWYIAWRRAGISRGLRPDPLAEQFSESHYKEVYDEKLRRYEDFRTAYADIQGKLFGMAERYITALDWTEVAAKVETDEELRKEKDIFYLVKTYIRKYAQKG